MKNITQFLLLVTLLGTSCKSVQKIFEEKTPHEKYVKKLDKINVDETPEGSEWIAVSKRALDDAQSIELPYRQTGYFHADKPRALGLRFKANFGERITFTLDKKAGTPFVIFAGVKEGGLGGKVVWLRVNDKNTYLYYAHLDKQSVHEGQLVKKGEVVGLVGNTGNAKNTPSHLHFGVYTNDGPINPLPFVNRAIKTAPAVPAKNLAGYLELIKTQKTEGGTLVTANTELVPLAVNAKGYLAELPNGNIIQTSFTSVKVLPQPIRPSTLPVGSIATR